MDLLKFEKFKNGCQQNLPKLVDEILSTGKQEDHCAIGLITDADLFGFFVTWEFGNDADISRYYEWDHAVISPNIDFLEQPLIDICEEYGDIVFGDPSEEKWDFIVSLLTVLQEVIKQIPDEIFQKNNFRRGNVFFFATMGDDDYQCEMYDTSIAMFNG